MKGCGGIVVELMAWSRNCWGIPSKLWSDAGGYCRGKSEARHPTMRHHHCCFDERYFIVEGQDSDCRPWDKILKKEGKDKTS